MSGGAIIEARIQLDEVIPAGSVVPATLVSIGSNGRNAVARLADGREALLPVRPSGISEGQAFRLEILRESIPGLEPWKRMIGRATDAELAVIDLAEQLGARELPFPPHANDLFEETGWLDLLGEAASGQVRFTGGELRISPTPAMTLIDVDGFIPSEQLARPGAEAAGAAIRRLGIEGSIGIDLPTTSGKSSRQAAAAALDAALGDVPFERTAVNGFGFVQVVRPRRSASLVELYADRANAEARALLRQAAKASGMIRLAAHPAVIAALERNRGWLDQLAREVGGEVTLRTVPGLAMSGGYAEQRT